MLQGKRNHSSFLYSFFALILLIFISAATAQGQAATASAQSSESEIIFSGQNSFGHFHMFANSWWSSLGFGSIEYDRHSWGHAAGARMDYSAEFQPVALLSQPSKTDEWGNPQTKNHELVYGLGIAPIGLRMTWREHKNLRPYLLAQGGLMGFTKKATSEDASYVNLTLHVGAGTQFHLADRWDGRVGFSYFHFSDAFMVPSNPGLDNMMYTAGLAYHLKGHRF